MNPAAGAARPPRWRQLHVRAALVAIALLALLCITVFALVRHYNTQAALEATQRINLGLARYVADHQPTPLISAQGEPDRTRMMDLAMNVMMINPAVEVYLLDRDGRVLAHALETDAGADPIGRQVDMAPIRRLVETAPDVLRLPVLGDDPRREGGRNVVSVAPLSLDGATLGYLYIVLNGRTLRGINASLANSDALRAVAVGLALATVLAGIVMVTALRKLTRPLRELTAELEAFRSDTDGADEPFSEDEISVLRAAVRALQQRIALQFKRLEESDSQRRELISNISHDLRTPLSSIQGYVETVLLRADKLDVDTRAQHLRTALRHIELLGKRIADLFDLSKLDAGRVEPKVEVFRLAELLQDVVQNFQLAAQQRNVRLHLEAGSHITAQVVADIALIERVLQNLVDNALRYTVAGGEVTVALTALESTLEISVSDTGRGIAQEHLPHIFERYWRASDTEAAGPGSSSGLGLAIVKRILDLHGSVIRVQSDLERGTRFAFTLQQAA